MAWRDQRTRNERAQRPPVLSIEEPTGQALADAAGLIGRTWYPDEPEARRGACEKIELAHHLKHATYVRAAMLGNRFAGIVAAAPTELHRHPKPGNVSALWYRDHMRAVAPWAEKTSDEAAIGVALAPITAEMALTQELLESQDDRAAWEVTLLIVDPACHGKGVGKALFMGALDYLSHQGAPGFFLATDDGCDFGFYDHLGLERIAEREAPGCTAPLAGHHDKGPFHVYLYGARLGDESDVR